MSADDSKASRDKLASPKALERQATLDRLYMPAMPPLGLFSWMKRHLKRLAKRGKRLR